MTIDIFLVGGGSARVELPADDLDHIAELMKRERGLVGRLVSMNGDDSLVGRVLIPCHRVALIAEV